MSATYHRGPRPQAQRGIATLVVVMVLLFVVAMVAAYTSRNMIFEQKTSSNQYRSTAAFEAAQAGIDWTLAMLNGGLIDDTCGNTAPALSFQQRYLSITSDLAVSWNGRIANQRGAGPIAKNLWPTCVFDGSRWGNPAYCTCPNAVAAVPAPPADGAAHPAFRVWPADPSQLISKPGAIVLQVNGCTRMPAGDENCLNFVPEGNTGDAVGVQLATVALRSGLNVPPAAPITARRDVTPAGGVAKLHVVNDNVATNGITIDAGGAINPTGQITAQSLPGAPSELSLVPNDTRLFGLETVAVVGVGPLDAAERMFVSQFGMRRQTYRDQPGLRRCPAPGLPNCATADLTNLLTQNPNRIIWVDGNVTLTASIGDAGAPVLLIVNGDTLTLGSGVTVTGFVYLTGGVAAAPARLVLPDGPSFIVGAVVSETSLTTQYAAGPSAVGNALTVTYNADVLNLLRTTYGSWVALPGGWVDFKE